MKRLIQLLLLSLTAFPVLSQINDGGTLPKSFKDNSNLFRNLEVVEITRPDLGRIIEEDEKEDAEDLKAPRIGVSIPVDLDLEDGNWTTLRNGDRIWQIRIKADGAKAMNLYFDEFFIANGCKMHVYSLDKKQVIGGFTSQNNSQIGNFGIELIYGSELIVELYEPKRALGNSKIHISEVGYGYRMITNPKESNYRDFGDSDPCEVNVNCSPEGSGKEEQRDAVARILFKAGDRLGWCSGTVINNQRQDCTPYMLTALQCSNDNGSIASASDFNQWIFYFNYQSSSCSNPGSGAGIATQSMTGASLIADSGDPTIATGSDFLLLEMNNAFPTDYNVYYAGWNRATSATTGGYGIHHPVGDIKKISTFSSTLHTTGWMSAAMTHWSVQWIATANGHGVTEVGSTGSALFNNSGQIVGTLSGGASSCNSTNSFDLYGKMDYHWNDNGNTSADRLSDWLDPDNSGVLSIGGTYFTCLVSDYDASIDEILYPTDGSLICENTINPQVRITNYGNLPLTSVNIIVEQNGSNVLTYNWTGNLGSSQSEIVNLPSITLATETSVSLEIYTSNPNGFTDEDMSNDSKTILTEVDSPANLPLAFDFNAGLPDGFIIQNNDNDGAEWSHTSSVGAYGSTGGSITIDNFNNDTRGTIDNFVIPSFNTTNIESLILTFDVAYARYDATFNDGLEVAVSTDCFNNYTTIYEKSSSVLATTDDRTVLFVPAANEWRSDTIDLSAYQGQDHVSIGFRNIGGFGQPIYIDNIKVEKIITGPYQNIDTGEKFETLYDAINGTSSSQTIILIGNAIEDQPIDIPAGVNFTVSFPYTITFINP